MEATLESNVAAWNEAFGKYVEFTKLTPQDALEHKVNALGIALWKGFSVHQFGGKPRNKGVAIAELKSRTSAGEGTKVRASLLGVYQQERASLVAKAKSLRQSLRSFGGTLNQWVGIRSALNENRAQRISAWQAIVGREVDARASGIGELGAAFLWYRTRGKGDQKRQVLNRRGTSIGDVEVNEGVALITGRVNGLNTVDARYNVVTQAIADETDDTMSYVKRKQDEAASQLMGNIVG